MSTTLDAPEIRLRSVPWRRLGRLAGPLSDALREVLAGSAAERVLDGLLRREKPLDSEERRALAEAVFGVGLWRRRLAWHVGANDPAQVDPRMLVFALVREVAGIDEETAREASGLGDVQVPARRPPPEDFALRESLPDWLARHLAAELGSESEAAAFARAINAPGPITLRTNTLIVQSREALAEALAEEGVTTTPGAYARTALHITGPRPNIYGLHTHQRGAFEVQDEGSQLLGELVETKRGEQLLDFCAGAGGKTLQLAAALRNEGRVHAWDLDSSRLDRLEVRALKARATCVRVHRQKPAPDFLVDRVLVDAPCSELGALRRGPDLRFRIDPRVLHELPATQREILSDASRHVRPGGRLVYSTCTLNRAENEEVAFAFEATHPDFRRITPGEGWLDPTFVTRDGFFLSAPHRHRTDGFFAAVWTRA